MGTSFCCFVFYGLELSLLKGSVDTFYFKVKNRRTRIPKTRTEVPSKRPWLNGLDMMILITHGSLFQLFSDMNRAIFIQEGFDVGSVFYELELSLVQGSVDTIEFIVEKIEKR